MSLQNKSTISLAVLAVILIAGGVWYARKPTLEAPPVDDGGGQEIDNPGDSVTDGGTQNGGVDTSDWKTYRNEEYGFEFQYPRDIRVFDCTDTMSGSYVYFRMRYINDDYDWCNAPGKAVPHSIYVELSQFMTRDDLTQTISSIENKSVTLKKDIKDDSIYLEYVFNEKDDKGNVIEPKINVVNKRAFIMVRDDLYISIGLIYEEKKVDAELKQKYEFAINQIFKNFVKID